MTGVVVAVVVALLLALAARLRLGRLNRRAARTPMGGVVSDFASPYRLPGRSRSGKGF